MSEQNTYERWLFRIGGVGAIVGALLGLVGNIIHPDTPTGDAEGVAKVIAESDIWVPVHVGIIIGLILMLGGLFAIYHSIRGGAAGALVRFGFIAAIVGITAGLVVVALDGLASRQLAEAWASAPPAEKAVAARLVHAEETLNFALLSLFNILFTGVTFIFYGFAVALSQIYPRWLGWVVAVAGLVGVVTGLIQAYVGESSQVTSILSIITPTIITLWMVLIGILLLRKASRL